MAASASDVAEDVIARAARGDAEAFGTLVAAYADLTLRVAAALLPDAASAEDAAQEAWVDVWHGLASFRPGEPFRPWLVTVVANRCRKQTRRRALDTIRLDTDLVDAARWQDDDTDAVLAAFPDPELEHALADLPDEQRQVLGLRFGADLDLATISHLTHTPLGTVKTRLRRALDTLRSRLASHVTAPRRGGSAHE
ncbi:MAG TPA: sigma-70 family RNA polymerase sigma factor [Ktedonobacterales bacterium]